MPLVKIIAILQTLAGIDIPPLMLKFTFWYVFSSSTRVKLTGCLSEYYVRWAILASSWDIKKVKCSHGLVTIYGDVH